MPGARLEGGLGKGECLRAAAAATVSVAAGELSAALSPTPGCSAHPAAVLQGLWEPSKGGSCCRLRGGGTAPVPSPPSPLLAVSRVMGNTAIAKKGSEVESGEWS